MIAGAGSGTGALAGEIARSVGRSFGPVTPTITVIAIADTATATTPITSPRRERRGTSITDWLAAPDSVVGLGGGPGGGVNWTAGVTCAGGGGATWAGGGGVKPYGVCGNAGDGVNDRSAWPPITVG